jgi:protein SCO1
MARLKVFTFTKRVLLITGMLTSIGPHLRAVEQHKMTGMLLEIDQRHALITVSCDAVPGYMDAKVVKFSVRKPDEIDSVKPGTALIFNVVRQSHKLYAEQLQIVPGESAEAEPTEAAQLEYLQRVINPAAAAREVPIGGQVPDFTLLDQTKTPTHLATFSGKVVVVSFTYSRCPNPNYCFRLSTNLALLRKRFRESIGRDLILMTIVIDPDNDREKALQEYADTWKAHPQGWRFLTGPLPQVGAVAELFGMSFWSDEGFLTHPFHTAVIDRSGRLAANIEGNQFTATQLGDLVQTVLRTGAPS